MNNKNGQIALKYQQKVLSTLKRGYHNTLKENINENTPGKRKSDGKRTRPTLRRNETVNNKHPTTDQKPNVKISVVSNRAKLKRRLRHDRALTFPSSRRLVKSNRIHSNPYGRMGLERHMRIDNTEQTAKLGALKQLKYEAAPLAKHWNRSDISKRHGLESPLKTVVTKILESHIITDETKGLEKHLTTNETKRFESQLKTKRSNRLESYLKTNGTKRSESHPKRNGSKMSEIHPKRNGTKMSESHPKRNGTKMSESHHKRNGSKMSESHPKRNGTKMSESHPKRNGTKMSESHHKRNETIRLKSHLNIPSLPLQASHQDITSTHLGHWTCRGSYYYYNPDPGLKTFDKTLLAVQKAATTANIPLLYFQLDSWFYPKDDSVLAVTTWDATKDVFPHGIEAFQKSLGLPLIAENR